MSTRIAAAAAAAAQLLALLALGCVGGSAGPPGTAVAAASLPALDSAALSLSPPGPTPPAQVTEAHADTKPLAADIVAMRQPTEVRISPDGELVAYLVRAPSFDPAAKASENDPMAGWKVEKQLFVVKRAGGEARQLTRAKESIASFRWSPDGRSLAFVRKRGERMALHVMPVDGGEAEHLDTGDLAPRSIEWSRDGASIAFLATPSLTNEEKEAAWRSGGVVDEDRRHRSNQLYVIARTGGEPRRLTQGTESVESFTRSPDGARFALLVSRSADPYDTWNHLVARIITAADGAKVKDLEPKPVIMGQMTWSPDGRYVAFLRGQGTLSLLNALTVHEVASGRSWNAAAKLDPTIGAYVWSADSKRLTLLVYERTLSRLYQVPVDGASARDLGTTARFVEPGSFDADRAGRFAAVSSSTNLDPSSPSALDLDKGAVRVVAQLNPQVAAWKLGRTEVVRWKSPEGPEIEGLLTTTPHVEAGKPAPLVVMPHGGPDGMSNENFSTWPLYFAARGYSVLRPNYRGGFAYGRDFYAANRGRLGEIELMDIESGVDHLIQAGKVDPKRLYYGSWSWGGYLTAWTIGHTKRYRAAMVGAGIVDVTFQYALSDINHGAAAEWEFKGNPWKQPEEFDDANPRRFLDKVTTPTLIVHGDSDDRVPVGHALILYRALQDVGCEVRLLRYPREPHGFSEPAHGAHRLASWAAWFDAH